MKNRIFLWTTTIMLNWMVSLFQCRMEFACNQTTKRVGLCTKKSSNCGLSLATVLENKSTRTHTHTHTHGRFHKLLITTQMENNIFNLFTCSSYHTHVYWSHWKINKYSAAFFRVSEGFFLLHTLEPCNIRRVQPKSMTANSNNMVRYQIE